MIMSLYVACAARLLLVACPHRLRCTSPRRRSSAITLTRASRSIVLLTETELRKMKRIKFNFWDCLVGAVLLIFGFSVYSKVRR
jgi:hypothetical protein